MQFGTSDPTHCGALGPFTGLTPSGHCIPFKSRQLTAFYANYADSFCDLQDLARCCRVRMNQSIVSFASFRFFGLGHAWVCQWVSFPQSDAEHPQLTFLEFAGAFSVVVAIALLLLLLVLLLGGASAWAVVPGFGSAAAGLVVDAASAAAPFTAASVLVVSSTGTGTAAKGGDGLLMTRVAAATAATTKSSEKLSNSRVTMP
jgi:hypothetical protein